MRHRSIIPAILFLLHAGIAAPVHAAGEAREAEIAELAGKPDSWFLDQVGGKPAVRDGEPLDVRVQYLFMQEYGADAEAGQAEEAPADPGATAEGLAALRRDANLRWMQHTLPGPAMDWVRDAAVTARHGGRIPVRIYRPKAEGTLPLLVYYHGGGWLFGDVGAVDRAISRMADEARVVIVSVDYRLAPEHPYPAAWEDAEDAYAWASANAGTWNSDPSRICVGGDSAGGNLSVAVTTRRQAAGKPAPACQLLYYPAVDNRSVETMLETYASFRLFGEGFGLDYAFTEYVLTRVFPGRDLAMPEISPLLAADVTRMPPTLLAASGFDTLRDSNRAYARRLEKAGVRVLYREFPTLPHGFLQLTAITPAAGKAASQTAQEFGRLIREAPAIPQ